MASNVKSHRGIRNKGAVGEREIVDAFTTAMQWQEALMLGVGTPPSGLVKRNSTQSDGGGFDLVGIPGLAVEIKRQETLSLGAWWDQTVEQASRYGGQPVLIYRQNKRRWRAVTWVGCYSKWVIADMLFDDFLNAWKTQYSGYLTSKGWILK